ncbi:MAG: peptidoglycan-binding domain-containing protein [Candidatus Omnitrophota bacterium]|jgi:peptidoglycan hydrolase-like protein with peptidoglycan-binding domain
MKKIAVLLLPVLIIALSGCASAKKRDLEIQGLKNQITVLETRIQSKDDEINSLRDDLSKSEAKKPAPVSRGAIVEIKSRPNAKQIQLALKNAGYYAGAIDGKIGKSTRDAIKAFQKANNLTADGRVGKKTWELLRKYLSVKIK